MSKRNCFFLVLAFQLCCSVFSRSRPTVLSFFIADGNHETNDYWKSETSFAEASCVFLVWKVENSNSFILFRGRVMICEELGQRGQGGLSTANAKRKRLMGIHCIRSHEKLLVLCYLGWHQPNSCLAGLTVKPFIAFFLPPVGTVVVVVPRTWSALNL